ncbi:MAG: hypothetical protein AAFN93_30060 [Bacteroidota bacterium]
MKNAMNRIYILTICSLGLLTTNKVVAQIEVEISREKDGETKVFKRSYESDRDMERDEEYREFVGDGKSFHFSFDREDAYVKLYSHDSDKEENTSTYFYQFGDDSDLENFDSDFDLQTFLENLKDRKLRKERRPDDDPIGFEELNDEELKEQNLESPANLVS